MAQKQISRFPLNENLADLADMCPTMHISLHVVQGLYISLHCMFCKIYIIQFPLHVVQNIYSLACCANSINSLESCAKSKCSLRFCAKSILIFPCILCEICMFPCMLYNFVTVGMYNNSIFSGAWLAASANR